MYEVIYYSLGGNTKKLAEAIAGELGVTAEDVRTKNSPSKDSDLFLGSGIYRQKPGKPLLDFIERNDWAGRKVVVFGTTSFFPESQLARAGKTLTDKGATVLGTFGCRGKFLIFGRNRPNEKDLENARAFARKMRGT